MNVPFNSGDLNVNINRMILSAINKNVIFLTSYFFVNLNKQIIWFLGYHQIKKIHLVSKFILFDRKEHYYGFNRMAKNQSDSCNFLYLMIMVMVIILNQIKTTVYIYIYFCFESDNFFPYPSFFIIWYQFIFSFLLKISTSSLFWFLLL